MPRLFLSRTYLVTALVFITSCVVLLATASSQAFAAATTSAQTAAQLQSFTGQILQSYMRSSSPTAVHGYADGDWYSAGGVQCWYCYDTAADGAATLGELQGNAQLQQTAINTFNEAIAQHQLPNGAFDNDSGAADGVGTGFFM